MNEGFYYRQYLTTYRLKSFTFNIRLNIKKIQNVALLSNEVSEGDSDAFVMTLL